MITGTESGCAIIERCKESSINFSTPNPLAIAIISARKGTIANKTEYVKADALTLIWSLTKPLIDRIKIFTNRINLPLLADKSSSEIAQMSFRKNVNNFICRYESFNWNYK